MLSYDKLSKDDTKDEKKNRHCSRKCKAYSIIILLVVCLIVILIVISLGNYKLGSNNKASLYFNRHRRHHDCTNIDYIYRPESNRYGCCEFKDNLNKIYTISANRNIKRDESGSNCPTYNNLIYDYIDYIEAYPIYFHIDKDIILEEKCIINNITLHLEKGHCPSTYTIKLAYENYYISPYSDYIFLGIIISLFLCFISLC